MGGGGGLGMVTRLVCSEVCWFICGQLGVLADNHSVLFVLANRELKQQDAVKRRGGQAIRIRFYPSENLCVGRRVSLTASSCLRSLIWLGRCGSVVGGMIFCHWLRVVCCTLGYAAGLFVSGCFSLSGLVLVILDYR